MAWARVFIGTLCADAMRTVVSIAIIARQVKATNQRASATFFRNKLFLRKRVVSDVVLGFLRVGCGFRARRKVAQFRMSQHATARVNTPQRVAVCLSVSPHVVACCSMTRHIVA